MRLDCCCCCCSDCCDCCDCCVCQWAVVTHRCRPPAQISGITSHKIVASGALTLTCSRSVRDDSLRMHSRGAGGSHTLTRVCMRVCVLVDLQAHSGRRCSARIPTAHVCYSTCTSAHSLAVAAGAKAPSVAHTHVRRSATRAWRLPCYMGGGISFRMMARATSCEEERLAACTRIHLHRAHAVVH